MKFNIINNDQDWDYLKPEWDQLLCISCSRVPFLEFDYLKAWWKTRGGHEWDPDQTHLNIITAEHDGHLIGIAPFFKGINRQGFPALMFLGCVEVSDYLDFIAMPETLPHFFCGLLDFLGSINDPAYELIDLYNIPESSQSLLVMSSKAIESGWTYTAEKLQPAPYVNLPSDWEAYLVELDKKQRHEIRRKLRRVQEDTDSQWFIVSDRSEVELKTNSFIKLMALDPVKEAFLTAPMQEHMLNTACQAMDNNWLHLSFLEINGEIAASYLCFKYDHHLWVYNSAWNTKFAQYSPGWVLLADIIQWGIKHGFHKIDFMRGDESYKYKFGGINSFVIRALLQKK